MMTDEELYKIALDAWNTKLHMTPPEHQTAGKCLMAAVVAVRKTLENQHKKENK